VGRRWFCTASSIKSHEEPSTCISLKAAQDSPGEQFAQYLARPSSYSRTCSCSCFIRRQLVYEWLALYLANLNSGDIRSSCSDSRVACGSLDSMTVSESFKDKAGGSTSLPFKRLMHDADQHLVKRAKHDGTLAIAARVAEECSPRSLTDDTYRLAAPSHCLVVCTSCSHKFVIDLPMHAHGPPPSMSTASRSYSKRCFLATPTAVPAFLNDICRSIFLGHEHRYTCACVACSAHLYRQLPSHVASQREYVAYGV
jgi:hypothetical protein